MGSSKAPKTPDYTAAAEKQGAADMEVAKYLTNANRINQVDPYGKTTWSKSSSPEQQSAQNYMDWANGLTISPNLSQTAKQGAIDDAKAKLAAAGGEGTYTQTTSFSPEQQALLEQQQKIQGSQNSRIADLLSSFQTPTLGAQRQLGPQRELAQRDLPGQRQLKEANQNNIQDLLYGQITKQYGDRFAKDEAAQRASLANQGFQMGSEGYNNTLNDFNRDKNSAYQDAATQAALSSYDQYNTERGLNQNEYNTLSGDDLARYGAQTTNDLNRFSSLSSDDLNRYGAQSSDDLNRYNSQMGFLSQLLGGVQGPTAPSYQPYAQATQFNAPDYMGAAQGNAQGAQNKANVANANKSNTMSTVGTIAAAAAVAF